ncbi:DUF2255 family protein [Actomonas aquatica]|uniref:DUF2255 family protein n=1 Tax=Actomonas aquatica TaxID=2866162 RepID=A0ABZ1C7Y9_9BACT|nr:DUF2255 family protein [Opitutus sp. WL0086]WRQ87621.1 DUF2255 family protein [Opitutus sp. WL0086]
MSDWNPTELARIQESDDLHIAPFRADGKTAGTPTWIWSVVVDDQLYVRAYSGRGSRWYQSALSQKAGRIHAAGLIKDVAFEPIPDPALNDRIDDAYRAKYADSNYLAPMVSERTRAATMRVTPRA